jgi:hypothetical protein
MEQHVEDGSIINVLKDNLKADYMEVYYEHLYGGEGFKGQLCDLNEECLLVKIQNEQ